MAQRCYYEMSGMRLCKFFGFVLIIALNRNLALAQFSDTTHTDIPGWGMMVFGSVLDRDVVRAAPVAYYNSLHHGFYFGPKVRFAPNQPHNVGLTGGYLYFPVACPHKADLFLEYSFSFFRYDRAIQYNQMAGIGFQINFDGHLFIQQSIQLGIGNPPATDSTPAGVQGIALIRFGIGYVFKKRKITNEKEAPVLEEVK